MKENENEFLSGKKERRVNVLLNQPHDSSPNQHSLPLCWGVRERKVLRNRIALTFYLAVS